MKKLVLAAAVFCAFVSSSFAKDFNVPPKDPVMKVTIPSTWKVNEIDYGYNTESPDGQVYFYIEYATGRRVDKMLDNNTAWMTENKIVPKGKPTESDITIAGLPAHLLHFDATYPEGDTMVDFVLIGAGEKSLVMLTLWANEKELKDNEADIASIKSSIKALK